MSLGYTIPLTRHRFRSIVAIMNLAWQFLKFGWRCMGDVGKLRTIWWLLPPAIAAGLTSLWIEAASSPLIIWLITVLVFVAVFIAVLTFAGYCELERQKATPFHFKADRETLRKLCLLLAHLKADATDYSPFQQPMLERLGELDAHRSLFMESEFASAFQSFWNTVAMAIDTKRTYLSPTDRESFAAMISKSYPELKAALDSDYHKSRH